MRRREFITLLGGAAVWPLGRARSSRHADDRVGFESALTNLGLKERNDPATTQVARLIISTCQGRPARSEAPSAKSNPHCAWL